MRQAGAWRRLVSGLDVCEDATGPCMLVQVLTWSCVCVVCARCVCGCDWLLWYGVFVLCVLRDEQRVSLRRADVRWYVAVCGAGHAGPCGECGRQGLGDAW